MRTTVYVSLSIIYLNLNLSECYNGIMNCNSIVDEEREVATINFGIKDVVVYTKSRYDKTDPWISMDDIDYYQSWYNLALEPSLYSHHLYKRDIKFEYKGDNVYEKLPNDLDFIGCFCYCVDEKTNIVSLSVDQIKR